MFKQQHVRLLVIVSLTIWIVSIVHFYSNSFKNNNSYQLQYALQEDITNKTEVIDKLLKSSSINLNTLRKSIPKDVFYYVYQKDKIIDWNNNKFFPSSLCVSKSNYELINLNNSRLFAKRFDLDKERTLVILIPLFISYPIENEYLQSHFIANEYIPNTTILSSSKLKDGFEIKDNKGSVIAYAKINSKEIKKYPPGYLDIVLVVIAVFFTYATINVFNLNFSKKRNQWKGLLFSIFIITFFRVCLIFLGLPFNARRLDMFSSNLYYNNFIVASLGDLFFNALGFMWIVSYVYKHTDYRLVFQKIKSKSLKLLLLITFVCFAIIVFYRSLYLTHSLIINDKVSFDISNVNSINFYSLVGLIIMCLLSGAAALTLNICNYLFNNLTQQRFLKYGLLILALFIFHGFLPSVFNNITTFCIIIWVVAYILLLDFLKFRIFADVTNLRTIYWLLFICFSFIIFFLYVENSKEFQSKINILKSIVSNHRDASLETTISMQQYLIDNDTQWLKALKPNSEDRSKQSTYLQQHYLDNINYDIAIELLMPSLMFNNHFPQKDVSSRFVKLGWFATENDKLYYRKISEGLFEYLYLLPKPISSKFAYYIHFRYKINKLDSYFPETLLIGKTKKYITNDYAIAKYYNGKLVFQTNKTQFPLFLSNAHLLHFGWKISTINKQSWIFYKKNHNEVFVILHDASYWLDIVLLFAFFFGISILFILFITLYRSFISLFVNKQYKNTLIVFNYVKKTHYSILFLALISFFVLSVVTVLFLHERYTYMSNGNILLSTRIVHDELEQYLSTNHLNSFTNSNDKEALKKINTVLSAISKNLKQNITVYSPDYFLLATTLDELHSYKLFSSILSDQAKEHFTKSSSSFLLVNEHLGMLEYQVAYMKLHNTKGELVGYLSISQFFSHAEIHKQLNYLIFSLIKLYALVFVLSTFFSFLITRGLTNSFNVIIKKLQSVNLHGNEVLSWPFDDEIGLLVSEYNKMISKLEKSAHVLAQSEREHAWKEMAQQVAHEIKNPLTPMRLNLQFLQNALRNNQDNTTEITKKVTDSLIEQIDNLNYIASEFSSFAKMPDPKVEVFNLVALLEKSISIYKYETNISIVQELPSSPIFIKSDKSQLLRVFSNLFQNAVQAIPEGRKGIIEVHLLIDNNSALIHISDNGVGINATIKESMFLPHFTTKNSGSGIGLAMSKRIIEYWNGSIWFDSIENLGTDFYVKLPILEQTIA